MKLFNDLGISIIHHQRGRASLAWGYKHGFGYKWLPMPIRRFILHLGNTLCCRIWGHDDILWHIQGDLPPDEVIGCIDCLVPLTECVCK